MPCSDKYEEAWIAFQERFGRVDTVVSAAKKRIDQFPTIVKENSAQIRQYQEMVSELIGIFKEHNFLHELSLARKSLKKLFLNFPHASTAAVGRVW